MKNENYTKIMDNIDDDLIEEFVLTDIRTGEQAMRKKRRRRIYTRAVAMAACFLLIVGTVVLLGDRLPGVFSDPHTEDPPSNLPGEPPPSMAIHSMEELEEMREMILCQDEQKLKEYLRSIKGGGADGRENLIFFVNLVDSVPYVHCFEGDIIWINYSKGVKGEEVLYITLEAPNGDWMRIEYIFSLTDVQAAIEERVLSKENGEAFLPPLKSKDEKLKVYHESRAPHPSGIGDSIRWIADLDGIFAYIVFYDSMGETLYPKELLPSMKVTGVPAK